MLLIRHSITDANPPDTSPIDLNNCATQRNLSNAGRDLAQSIGAGIRKLNIPIGQVLAGPFCRAAETARLAFGRAQLSDALLEANYGTTLLPVAGAPTPPPVEQRLAALKKLLATPPTSGTNTVLVTHSGVISRALSLSVQEGETSIFKPDGTGGYTLVGRVLGSEWNVPAPAEPAAIAPAALPRAGDDIPWAVPAAALLGSLLLATGIRLRAATA